MSARHRRQASLPENIVAHGEGERHSFDTKHSDLLPVISGADSSNDSSSSSSSAAEDEDTVPNAQTNVVEASKVRATGMHICQHGQHAFADQVHLTRNRSSPSLAKGSPVVPLSNMLRSRLSMGHQHHAMSGPGTASMSKDALNTGHLNAQPHHTLSGALINNTGSAGPSNPAVTLPRAGPSLASVYMDLLDDTARLLPSTGPHAGEHPPEHEDDRRWLLRGQHQRDRDRPPERERQARIAVLKQQPGSMSAGQAHASLVDRLSSQPHGIHAAELPPEDMCSSRTFQHQISAGLSSPTYGAGRLPAQKLPSSNNIVMKIDDQTSQVQNRSALITKDMQHLSGGGQVETEAVITQLNDDTAFSDLLHDAKEKQQKKDQADQLRRPASGRSDFNVPDREYYQEHQENDENYNDRHDDGRGSSGHYSAGVAQEQLDALGLFAGVDDDDEDEKQHDLEKALSRNVKWWQIRYWRIFMIAQGVAIILLIVGVILQAQVDNKSDNNYEYFRWFYFLCAWPTIWVIMDVAMHYGFRWLEWWFFRESLLYLKNVQRNTVTFLFLVSLLPWYQSMFVWAWCTEDRCQSNAYVSVVQALWRVLLCVMLFCLGNLLKGIAAKLLSVHFYRSAHFQKLQAALEKEVFLKVLSRPKRKVLKERQLEEAMQMTGRAVESQDGLQGSYNTKLQQALDSSHGGGVAHTLSAKLESVNGVASQNGGAFALAVSTPHNVQAAYLQPNGSLTVVGTPHTVRTMQHASTFNVANRSFTRQQSPLHSAAVHRDFNHSVSGLQERHSLSRHSAGLMVQTAPRNSELRQPPQVSEPLQAQPHATTLQQPLVVHLHDDPKAHTRDGNSANEYSTALPSPPEYPRPSLEVTSPRGSPRFNPLYIPPPPVAPLPPPPAPAPDNNPSYNPRSGINSGPNSSSTNTGVHADGLNVRFDTAGLPSIDAGRPAVPDQHTITVLASPGVQDPPLPTISEGSGRASSAHMLHSEQGAEGVSASGLSLRKRTQTRDGRVDSVTGAIPSSSSPTKRNVSTTSKRGGPGQGPASTTSERARRNASFSKPLGPLARDIIQTVPLQNAANKDIKQMSDDELERVRTAVVIKTYTAIIRNYGVQSSEDTERERAAIRAFSRALFNNIRSENDSRFLTLDDFNLFFDNPEHALQAFFVFDTDGDGTVSRKEVREAVEAIHRERANMADSLRDTDAIVQSLEWAVGALVHFLFLALYLIIWRIDIVQGFSTFSATLLAFTFVFGHSVQQAFEAMLFLFAEHPYDVGDNISVKEKTFRVKKITLLHTELVSVSGERIFYPNTELIKEPLVNHTRTRTQTEFAHIAVDVGVPPDVVNDILSALRQLAEANATEFDGLPFVQYRSMLDPMKVVLLVSWTYSFPPDNWRRLVPARNAMYGLLQAKLFEHGLKNTVQETEIKSAKRPAAHAD